MFRAKLGQIAKTPEKVSTQRGGAGVFSADWIRGRSSCVARKLSKLQNCKRPLRCVEINVMKRKVILFGEDGEFPKLTSLFMKLLPFSTGISFPAA